MPSLYVKPPKPANAQLWESFWLLYKQHCSSSELITIARQDTFLTAYARHGTAKAGCEAVGCIRQMYDWWLQNDVHHFRDRLAVARDTHIDMLESMMLSRLEDPKGNRGSDILLMFNLKAKRPEVYRELPIVVGGDASRDLLAGLANMMARQIAAQLPTKVEHGDKGHQAIPETIEGKVVRVLNPGKPTDDTPGTELP